eukprot:3394667-Prymnesium_polylepis.1
MDHLGMPRLGVAASRGDADEVKRLLTTDKLFERDVYGNTAAHYAIARYVTSEDKSTDTCVLVFEDVEILRIPNKNKQVVAILRTSSTARLCSAPMQLHRCVRMHVRALSEPRDHRDSGQAPGHVLPLKGYGCYGAKHWVSLPTP